MNEPAIDPKKFPRLARAIEAGRKIQEKNLLGWKRVAEMKARGEKKEAARLVRQLLDVHSDKPMPEELKERWKAKRDAMTPEERRAEAKARRDKKRRMREAMLATGRPQVAKESKDKEVPMKSPRKSSRKSAARRSVRKTAKRRARGLDPRVPPPGSIIRRDYKGSTIEVLVVLDGGKTLFQYQGQRYRSLSGLASKVTGSEAINGFAFFNLDKVEAKKEPVAATS